MKVYYYHLNREKKYLKLLPSLKSKYIMFEFEDKSTIFARINLKKHNILVLPGLGGNITDRIPFIKEVEKHNGTIYMDFPGFGNSHKCKLDTLEEYYKDTNQKLNKIFKFLKIDRVSIVGNCFGTNYFLHNFNKLKLNYEKIILITPNSKEFINMTLTKFSLMFTSFIAPFLEILIRTQERQRHKITGFKIIDMSYYNLREGWDTIYELMKISDRKVYRKFCKLMFNTKKIWTYYEKLKKQYKNKVKVYFFLNDHFVNFKKKKIIQKFKPIMVNDIMHFNYRIHGIFFYKRYIKNLLKKVIKPFKKIKIN